MPGPNPTSSVSVPAPSSQTLSDSSTTAPLAATLPSTSLPCPDPGGRLLPAHAHPSCVLMAHICVAALWVHCALRAVLCACLLLFFFSFPFQLPPLPSIMPMMLARAHPAPSFQLLFWALLSPPVVPRSVPLVPLLFVVNARHSQGHAACIRAPSCVDGASGFIERETREGRGKGNQGSERRTA